MFHWEMGRCSKLLAADDVLPHLLIPRPHTNVGVRGRVPPKLVKSDFVHPKDSSKSIVRHLSCFSDKCIPEVC